MIRPFTFLCMVGALGSGLYLYQCKHQAQVLDREIARTIKQTEAARDRISMLRTEWTQLNQPDRVDDLARAHTTLQTAKPTQFVSVADLAVKLPAPVALPPPAPLQATDVTPEEAQAEPATPAKPPEAAKPVAESAKPAAEAPARPAAPAIAAAPAAPASGAEPRVAETRRPEGKAETKVDAKADTKPDARAARVRQAAAARPAAAARTAPHHAAEATVATASVLRPRSLPEPVAPYVQPVAAPAYTPSYAPSYAPAAAASPMASSVASPGGSVLGGSRSLPPPVPFAVR